MDRFFVVVKSGQNFFFFPDNPDEKMQSSFSLSLFLQPAARLAVKKFIAETDFIVGRSQCNNCENEDSCYSEQPFHITTGVARWFLFRPKNPNLRIFWMTLEWKMLKYILASWNISRPLGILHGLLAIL
jgi:hypothetical protein